jgi:hypothetical protein
LNQELYREFIEARIVSYFLFDKNIYEKLASPYDFYYSSCNAIEKNPMMSENPSCTECNTRTLYEVSKYGPFWCCEECDWRKNSI